MKIVAIIPARGESKGIKDKNLINFNGKPLIYWTIKQALKSRKINEVVVSSDSEKIINLSKKFGAKTILRPSKISGDKATSESALIHAINQLGYSVDTVVFLQATSPLRNNYDIDSSIETFFSKKLDSLFSASLMDDLNLWVRSKKNLTSLNYDWKNRIRRQDKKNSIFCENGSIYITKAKKLIENRNRICGKFNYYEMENWQSFEIDSEKDVKLMELIFKNFVDKK